MEPSHEVKSLCLKIQIPSSRLRNNEGKADGRIWKLQ